MVVLKQHLAAELSLFRDARFQANWTPTLHYCETTIKADAGQHVPTTEELLIRDLIIKTLQRGRRPFTSYQCEREIIARYGKPFKIKEKSERVSPASITWDFDDSLIAAYEGFSDFLDPWKGKVEEVAFDPDHPENERLLFGELVRRFGTKIAHCVITQAELDSALPPDLARHFLGQRTDFLLTFPNASGLVLEPGNHDEPAQIRLDHARDRAFAGVGYKTLRPRNSELDDDQLYSDVADWLHESGSIQFITERSRSIAKRSLALNYLILLPTLVARIERLLTYFLLEAGLIRKSSLSIGVIERDLNCTEIAWTNFTDRLTRISDLYGYPLKIPDVRFQVQRNTHYSYPDAGQKLTFISCVDQINPETVDLLLDVGIKCNAMTPPVLEGVPYCGATRRAAPHYSRVDLSYRSSPQAIVEETKTEELLCSFVQDFFRKRSLRQGQGPIIRSIMAQKSTIGLLPTSAGKSLCYQLASLLTPGTTIVVDPLVALMNDQVQTLSESCGIDRVLPWHAGSGLTDAAVGSYLSQNIMIFVSPERLQRPGFRAAMRSLSASDIFVNYGVIDEAHCVSMWGHDFRPSYLMLARNFRQQCAFQGHEPVIAALTGTASQLVLIDLMRELEIRDPDAVIRPDSFDRPELTFRLIQCRNDEKKQILGEVMAGIARRLNVMDLSTDAHGIIFTYTPTEAWDLFGSQVGNAKQYARSIRSGVQDGHIKYGIYTGNPPKSSGIERREWDEIKSRTLAAFKRGAIRMLVGNAAVSVGIDNEYLNYVVNFRMPQSMEAYYQQCGRAGRAGQKSECVLLFSDDLPAATDKWLSGQISNMPRRWDDLGTVAYFHQNNFPGIKTDIDGAWLTLSAIFKNADDDGFVDVPAYLKADFTPSEADRTERYLSYWLILGIIVDYEVTGTGRNTRFRVSHHPSLRDFLAHGDELDFRDNIVNSLHNYLQRYRPISLADVKSNLNDRPETRLSEQCIAYLIEFIYQQIEYQRRAAIRTMVEFCRESDKSEDKIRSRIKGYFDSSEKFSFALFALSSSEPEPQSIHRILKTIEGFDDVEHLYWETRRLLDERYRVDWAGINIFSLIYRNRGDINQAFKNDFIQLVTELRQTPDKGEYFLPGYLSSFQLFESAFDSEIGFEIIKACFDVLLTFDRTDYLPLVQKLSISDELRSALGLHIIKRQIKEILHVGYSKITRRDAAAT